MLLRLINYAKREHADRELVSASLWSLVVRGSGAVLTFLLGVILARTLGPEDFGVYGIVIAMAFLLSVLSQAGLPTLSTREVAVASSRQDWPLLKGIVLTFSRVVVFASTIGGGALAGAAFFLPSLFGKQSIAFAIGGSLVPLFAITVLVVAMLRGFGRTVLSQSIELLVRPAVTLICVAGFFLAVRLNATIALALSALAALITLAIALRYLLRTIPRAAHRAAPMNRRSDWVRAAWPMATIEMLRQVEGSYGILLIGAFASDSAAGFFRLAFSTMMVAVMPLGILHMVLAPTLARLSAEGETAGLRRVLAISATLMFLAASLATAVLWLVGKPLIALIFGKVYIGAWLPLITLMAAQMLTGFFGVGSMLLAMGGGERDLTVAYAFSLTVAGATAIPLVLLHGATGAAAAAIAGAAVLNFFVWRAIKHRFGIDCSLFGAVLHWRRI
jgi:O-antigen/teichoic acid export membrane protein